jgi:hypothetical protein
MSQVCGPEQQSAIVRMAHGSLCIDNFLANFY